MISDQQAQTLATASNAAYPGSLEYVDMLLQYGYTRQDNAIPSDPNTGFSAVVFKNEATNAYIVAFTGTQSAQDAAVDIGLGTLQWKNNSANVMNYLSNLPIDAQIAFTGHSLGGALAQYAAYDYLQANDSANVSLATYNGIGGIQGLEEMNGGSIDLSVLSRLDAANFFAVSSGLQDIVSRLGGGHFGGNTYAIEMSEQGKWLDSIHSAWNDFKNLTIPDHTTSTDYLNIDAALSIANYFTFFGDDGKISNTEGALRALGGVFEALMLAPNEDIKQLFDAMFPASFPYEVDWGFIRNAINPALMPFAIVYGLGAIGIANGLQLADQFGDFLNQQIAAGSDIYNTLLNKISSLFTTAQSVAQPRRDPLTLDLDNDGLETVGINTANPILFDHDADGVKTATGWIKPDDGFLVLDRNGNGTIDNGRELFGDSTPLLAGGKAADGFAALAQEDTNADGVVDANDARFASLRVWRDLNSDGISQANELQTLNQVSIAAIHVAKTENAQVLPNGNQLADLGTFIRTDGSSGGLGEVTAQMADIDLAEDTFHSSFSDTIAVSDEIAQLPAMNGSGRVRSLHEAASLSPVLTGLLGRFTVADGYDSETRRRA